MAELRDFIGTKCPVCAQDILQTAPSKARMPPGNYLVCPACESELDLEVLTGRSSASGPGFFRRLFARGTKV